jgi:long-chain acyl-CoA synthetase
VVSSSTSAIAISPVIDVLKSAWEELTAPGAQFAWSEQVVRGIPMRVFDQAPPNMRFLWELSAGFSDRPYIVFEDEVITYGEAHAEVRSLAHKLVDDYGVGKGDRVAIAMRNYPEWAISYWAVISIGAAAVGVNAWWTSSELEYGLSDSRPKVVIADDERLERILPVLDSLRDEGPMHVISVRSDRELPADAKRWDDVVDAANAPDALPDADIDPDDDMCIFYTSGTTGFPKGAQLTHRGSVHNLLHLAFANTSAAIAASRLAEQSGVQEEKSADVPPTIMVPTPLFHVTANNCVLHPGTATGAKLVFMHKWDAGRALELIEREQVVSFTGVPTMSREMLLHPDWETRDTSSMAAMGGGGAALQPDLVEKIDSAKGAVKPSTGYGLTETHGIITAVGNIFFSARPTSAGLVMPTLEAKVIDEDGNDLPEGSRGELCVKGPVVVKGYLNRPEATAEAIQDGWFRTGDIVYIDEDGFVHIVDRAKDMLLRGGENVYCAEVEAAIYEHENIAEAAVFGVPDDRLGEAVGVAIFLREGTTLTEEELAVHLEPRLAKFKIPAHVWFRDGPLPQNANGKFLKRELREELAPG